jgi:nitroreductase
MDIAATDELLTTTRSVRKRLDLKKSVDPKVVERCIEIAFQSPTGSNRQGWHFLVVTDAAKRKGLGDLYKRAFEV